MLLPSQTPTVTRPRPSWQALKLTLNSIGLKPHFLTKDPVAWTAFPAAWDSWVFLPAWQGKRDPLGDVLLGNVCVVLGLSETLQAESQGSFAGGEISRGVQGSFA